MLAEQTIRESPPDVAGRVARALDEHVLGTENICRIGPDLARRAGVEPGDVLSLRTAAGRQVLARLGGLLGADEAGRVRLPRLLRQSLKAKLDEQVRIGPATLGTVQEIGLLPSADVSTAIGHNLQDHIKQTLIEHQTPVSEGLIVYATFPHSVAGTTYRVTRLLGAPGLITPETRVRVEFNADAMLTDLALDVTYEDVGGLTQQIRLVRELVETPLRYPFRFRALGINPPKGILFTGPPGTGKTHLARALAQEVNARFYYINGPDVVGTMYGETEGNLRRIFGEATHHAPSLIFIDEVDALAPRRGETGAHSDTRTVTQLLSLMDGLKRTDGLIVIGTTNRVESIDTALRRPGRFDREIYFGPPEERGRYEILQVHAREMPLTAEAIDHLKSIAARTPGFVGADLMEVCREAGLNALRRTLPLGVAAAGSGDQEDLSGVQVTPADFDAAVAQIRPSASRQTLAVSTHVTWDDVGGLEAVKARLTELIQWPLQRAEAFRGVGLEPPTGVLLYGPPGCGKTLLAKAVATESGANFIPVNGPEIFTKWLGESEEAIRNVFRVARQLAPSIIFVDQLDAVAPLRGEGDTTRTVERVVNQLLSELDGIEPLSGTVVMAATNRIELVDPSVLRPGRIGTHIHVPLPDERGRAAIVHQLLANAPVAPGTDLRQLAGQVATSTVGFTGAELKQLADDVKLIAVRQAPLGQTPVIQPEFVHEALIHTLAGREREAESQRAATAGDERR